MSMLITAPLASFDNNYVAVGPLVGIDHIVTGALCWVIVLQSSC